MLQTETTESTEQTGLGFTLNPFTLPFVDLHERVHLPSKPGLYFVFDGSTLLYIGRSKNLNTRWKKHHRYKQVKAIASKPQIAFLDLEDEKLLWVERQLITRFKPKLNDTKVDFSSQSEEPSQPNWTRPSSPPPTNSTSTPKKPRTLTGWVQIEDTFEDAFSKQVSALNTQAAAVRSIFARLKQLSVSESEEGLSLCAELDKSITDIAQKHEVLGIGNSLRYPTNIKATYEASLLSYYRKKYPDG